MTTAPPRPTYGDNFLLAFDYQPPGKSGKIQNILFIHSTIQEHSQKAYTNLRKLYPEQHFFLLKRAGTQFTESESENESIIEYPSQLLPEDFHTTTKGRELLDKEIDQVFFGINRNIRPEGDPLDESFAGCYDNIFRFLLNAGLYDRTHAFDNQFAVYPAPALNHFWKGERFHLTWDIHGHKIKLPWTLLAHAEKETLFELARSCDGNGAIVNIGNFLGGSSILLAKGSKLVGREKVYSFDIDNYAVSEEMYLENEVADWIIFKQKSSLYAAQEWKTKKDPAIRLLLIDGDHSYEGCRNDILAWSDFIVPGGTLAVHDYGNVSQGAKYASIVNAVHDTILTGNGFNNFRRKDTLFLATKAK